MPRREDREVAVRVMAVLRREKENRVVRGGKKKVRIIGTGILPRIERW